MYSYATGTTPYRPVGGGTNRHAAVVHPDRVVLTVGVPGAGHAPAGHFLFADILFVLAPDP